MEGRMKKLAVLALELMAHATVAGLFWYAAVTP